MFDESFFTTHFFPSSAVSDSIPRDPFAMLDHPLKRRRASNRRGVTAVEFAITAPIVFLFFFAAFECCRAAMIRHTADNAVYEACRAGILPGATANEVRAQADEILATVGITSAQVAVLPSQIERDTPRITVQIRVPLDDNSFVPPNFFGGKMLTRELTMRREGVPEA